jgi:hypothetical protein
VALLFIPRFKFPATLQIAVDAHISVTGAFGPDVYGWISPAMWLLCPLRESHAVAGVVIITFFA